MTDMVGPGPNALHRKWRFTPDYAYHRDEMRRIYDESFGLVTYLGDWHSHPDACPHLSGSDRRALRNIARFPDNYVECPVMLILGSKNKNWTPAAWGISRSAPCSLWARWAYLGLEICEYQ